MKSGIYKIVNLLNGKIYVGSSKNLEKRFKTHKSTLNLKKHHNIHLQRAWLKYGEDSFLFEIIEETKNLFEREQYWMDTLKPDYNIGSVGGGDNLTLHPNKAAIIAKISKANLGRKCKQRFGDENPNWRGGTSKSYCSCGSVKALSAKNCINCTDKTGEANPFYGKKHTEEIKKALSERKKGLPNLRDRKRISVDGVFYESATEAARELGVSNATITYRVKSKYYNYYYVNYINA